MYLLIKIKKKFEYFYIVYKTIYAMANNGYERFNDEGNPDPVEIII